ncbi:hypothetical protein N665_0077s0042 [Sinapis alba]|nr:hypothetical protein N665_0077s0042 [Sinapis alba]
MTSVIFHLGSRMRVDSFQLSPVDPRTFSLSRRVVVLFRGGYALFLKFFYKISPQPSLSYLLAASLQNQRYFPLPSLFFLSLDIYSPIKMSSPLCRCSLKGKAVATGSDSENSGSPLIRRPRTITLGGMDDPRPTTADLVLLDDNEHDVVRYSLELEDREATGHAPADDMEKDPPAGFKSVRRLIFQTNPPAGFSFLISAEHQRPWTPPEGYATVYESCFTNCSLWWPLPEFLTTYCNRRKIALGQYTANGIRVMVTLTVLAAELGITMSVRLVEELTTPSITGRTGFFYGKMIPKYNVITGKPSKVNFWNHRYFYVKINEASFEDPSIVLNRYFNANIDRLSKWSQGGTESFLEEVEAIRTLSQQHWPDISEARIQTALNRISRAENRTEIPSQRQSHRMEHLGGDQRDQDPSIEENPSTDPASEAETIALTEMPMEEHPVDPSTGEGLQGDQRQEPVPTSHGGEVVEYPHVIDFKYRSIDVPFIEDHEPPARLFRQIKLKKRGMPKLDQLHQDSRYRKMTRACAIFFENANLMVRDYEMKLRAQEASLEAKTRSLKKKRKEIAELAYKCSSYEGQIEGLVAEKNEASEKAKLERSRSELLSAELEALKAEKELLDSRCLSLEQEKSELSLNFERTTRRLRESREHEVKKERLRVESVLRKKVMPTYEKMGQFIRGQTEIQSKLALYSRAKGTREGLEKIQTQGLSMDEVLQKARTDETHLLEELQKMEIVDASEIDLLSIDLDEHGSNMTVFSPEDIQELRT